MLSVYGFWEYWELRHKVTFDGITRTITINDDEVNLDADIDIYSAWKEWVKYEDNSKFLPALTTIGGQPLPGDLLVGRYFFLINGWKLVPPLNSAELGDIQINGNLFSDDGSDIFTTAGTSFQLIRQTVSNLTNISLVEVTGSMTLDPATVVTASLIPNQRVIATEVESPVTINQGQLDGLYSQIESASLSPAQETMLMELYKIMGLDPTKPLVVTPTGRAVASDIVQTFIKDDETVIVQRE